MTKNKKNHHVSQKAQENSSEAKSCCALEKKVVTACDSSCCCEGACASKEWCKCADACKCHSKKSCKTGAKCLTMLISALMISTSILFVGMEMTKPQVAHRPIGNIDPQITDYLRRNAGMVAQVVVDHQEKIQAERAAEEERARAEAERQQAEKVKDYVAKIATDASYHSLGNKDGKYVIVEFFDYRCGWCKKTNTALWAEIDGGKAPNIRWIPVDAPIFGEGSAIISRYVISAGKQGKFAEMHHEVSSASGNLDKAALDKLAEKIGLNMEQLHKDVDSEAVKTQLDNNMKMAEEIGVQGVPFMIVNGRPHGGALLNEALAQTVKESNEMK